MLVEESSSVLAFTLGACALALLLTLCIVCHRKRHRRRQAGINHERRPFAPPAFDSSLSRPSLPIPTETPIHIPVPIPILIPSPTLASSFYSSLPPLTIEPGENV